MNEPIPPPWALDHVIPICVAVVLGIGTAFFGVAKDEGNKSAMVWWAIVALVQLWLLGFLWMGVESARPATLLATSTSVLLGLRYRAFIADDRLRVPAYLTIILVSAVCLPFAGLIRLVEFVEDNQTIADFPSPGGKYNASLVRTGSDVNVFLHPRILSPLMVLDYPGRRVGNSTYIPEVDGLTWKAPDHLVIQAPPRAIVWAKSEFGGVRITLDRIAPKTSSSRAP